VTKVKLKNIVSNTPIYVPLFIFTLFCIVPFIVVVSGSFSDNATVVSNGVRLFPQVFSLTAYKVIFAFFSKITRAYGVAIFVTVIGTVLNLIIMVPFAFAISKREFTFGAKLTFLIYFTVMFSGGLIPTYILIKRYLGLYDTVWVLILPLLASPSYIVLLRVFFQSVPKALYESAAIDGANEFQQLIHVGIPLALPGIAAIAFFSMLMYWNDPYTAIIYIEDSELFPIQILLTQMTQYINYIKSNASASGGLISSPADIPTTTILFALGIVASGPMIFVFSFFQKYFIKGLTAGSVKE